MAVHTPGERTRPSPLLAALLIALLTAGAAHAEVPEQPGEPGEDPPVEFTNPKFGDRSSPIRPGSSMNGTCTFNYVFYERVQAPEVPSVFIGTAAHCTQRLGERVRLGTGQAIGTVVYDADVAGNRSDFSLVRIDQALVPQTNPTVRGWGGPSGVARTGDLGVGDQVNLHGHGMVVGDTAATRSRWGLLVGWSEREYVADMPAVNGDSGAPVLHDRTGRALGIVSRYGVTATPPSTDTGPRISWILGLLAAAAFDTLVLARAQ
jgi:hypothetical protein